MVPHGLMVVTPVPPWLKLWDELTSRLQGFPSCEHTDQARASVVAILQLTAAANHSGCRNWEWY
jgi:hypothetical protein